MGLSQSASSTLNSYKWGVCLNERIGVVSRYLERVRRFAHGTNTVLLSAFRERSFMPYTLAELDEMTLEQAHALPFVDRDQLLDLIIAAGRHQSTDIHSYRVGLYCDYFEEDLLRLYKVDAIKVHCRGTTSSGFDGMVVGETDADQYRAGFRHVQTHLEAAGSSFSRVVSLVIFLTDMDNWPLLNEIYREFMPNPPCRAVIGTTGLAQPPLAIEIVECIAYRVRD